MMFSALSVAFVLSAAAIAIAVFGGGGQTEGGVSSSAGPPTGRDHWHAGIAFYACGVKQPNAPTWESGVHTHSDGIIHIHPFHPFEEGRGARLVKWFEYGGGVLTQDRVRMPGSPNTFINGAPCNGSSPAAIHVIVN